MRVQKNILAIIGSASQNSANQLLVHLFVADTKDYFNVTIFNHLKALPHFNPELSLDSVPKEIVALRKAIEQADGVLICSPEYVFSIPSGLKNALEWCVSTTVFSNKPVGLITASAHGQKGHEELQLIMKTLTAKFTPDTILLIQGIKGKINERGELTDAQTTDAFHAFVNSFQLLLSAKESEILSL
jgi:chromate reductase, NAD(P)H dehydrogenase (quinone)